MCLASQFVTIIWPLQQQTADLAARGRNAPSKVAAFGAQAMVRILAEGVYA
jgi:hypothetical protein